MMRPPPRFTLFPYTTLFRSFFHDLVNRFTVLDGAGREFPRDDRRPSADDAGPQRPDSRPHERFTLRRGGAEIEQHGHEEQGRRKIVEYGVPARSIVAEH